MPKTIQKFKPFSLGEIKRLERIMSEENRAALEARLEELEDDLQSNQWDWVEGSISYDQAVETSSLIMEEMKEIVALLAQ